MMDRFFKYVYQRRMALATIAVIGMAAMGILLIGFAVLAEDISPPVTTPTTVPLPSVQVSSTEIEPGETITVTGAGWQPGEILFVRLDTVAGDEPTQATIASATVTEDGRFSSAFPFPSDPPWPSVPQVLLTIWSPTTGDEAYALIEVSTAERTPTPESTPTDTPTPTRQPMATDTPTSVSPPTATRMPSITAWRGEYYSNRDLAGGPRLVRDDPAVDFDWGASSPSPGLPVDGFSARWTRTLYFPSGTYRFFTYSDDGVRVWLDGELIINEWHDASGTTYAVERTLNEGSHTLRIEYYENRGLAKIELRWERLGFFPQWRGEYFSNVSLIGGPVLVRNDGEINFNWGRGAPAVGIPADRFSARWTRVLPFEAGLYRFHAIVDDGVRLYVDDVLVIDAWQDGPQREVTGDRILSAGDHDLRIEYYERTGDALVRVWWERITPYPDWKGEYWSNRALSGVSSVVRNDQRIDFDWERGAPAASLPSDNFSARWTRTADFDMGTYRFHVLVDDGARLWVDDQRIIDEWRDGAAREVTADYALTEGAHELRVDYYEHGGEARIAVWWEEIPSPSYPDWKGEYWSNRTLSGSPALVRNDRVIDFHWGTGSPAVGLPSDQFSTRWSRRVDFQPGIYRFYAWSDDGIRLYVDGILELDEWHVSSGEEVYAVDRPLSGSHRLVVEYFEESGQALVKFWWTRVGDLPTPVPTVTLRPTETSTPTPTSTLRPSPTSVPTATPTGTPTATPTTVPETPTPTATSTPGDTPTFTPEPTTVISPTDVYLNEILPAPAAIDWNGDGTANAQDEWIELYNAGAAAIDLEGWVLESGESPDVVESHVITAGTTIQPNGFVVFYGTDMSVILNDEEGEVRLRGPDGEVLDEVEFGALFDDASLSRDEMGDWQTGWPPSPGAPNSPTPLTRFRGIFCLFFDCEPEMR